MGLGIVVEPGVGVITVPGVIVGTLITGLSIDGFGKVPAPARMVGIVWPGNSTEFSGLGDASICNFKALIRATVLGFDSLKLLIFSLRIAS